MGFSLGDRLGVAAAPNRFWCDGKVAHKSQGAAEAHVRSLIKRGLSAPGDDAVYKCVTCLKFHCGRKRTVDTHV